MPAQTTLADWISRESIPFSPGSAESLNAAIDQLVRAMGGSVELLGFGEALHGCEELLVFRNQLFQRLAEKHGFSAIAIESSFPRSRLANDYIAGRGPTAVEAVLAEGFSHGFGGFQSNRELIGWMRRWNADTSHGTKLSFYGFDSPTEMMFADSPRRVLQFVLDYLAGVDPGDAHARRDRIESLLGHDAAWENQAATMDPSQSIGLSPAATALRIETEDLITELQLRRPELVAKSIPDQFTEAFHYASLARQLLNYHAVMAGTSAERVEILLGIRDAMMADNLAYIVARERGRGKVLAFAHNAHLQRSKSHLSFGPTTYRWWPAGAHLNDIFGPRYAVIGSALGVSEAHGIGPPEPGTLEAQFSAAPGPARFIPTRRAQGFRPAETAALPTRSGSQKNPTYYPLTSQSLHDFDWVASFSEI